MSNDLPSPVTDYLKLTVPQLKATCKELSITGYSKLGKAALLEKLTQHGGQASQKTKETVKSAAKPAVQSSAPKAGKDKTTSSKHDSRRSDPDGSALDGAMCDGQLLQESSLPQNISRVDQLSKASSAATDEVRPTTSSTPSISSIDRSVAKIPSKRKENPFEPSSSTNTLNSKRDSKIAKLQDISHLDRRLSNTSLTLPILQKSSVESGSSNKTFFPTQRSEESTGAPTTVSNVRIETAKHPEASSQSLARKQVIASRHPSTQLKRFVPPRTIQRNSLTKAHQSSNHPIQPCIDFISFDGPSLVCLSLKPIEMPPSLSQRKRVHAWSVILSGLSNSERRQCVLVSRMLRYAGMHHHQCTL